MSNTTICVTPAGQSITQGNKFQLTFDRIANTILQCTKVNIPGMTLTEAVQPSAVGMLKVPGTKLIFEPLDITFLVDVQYNSWFDIWNWLNGLGSPESQTQYGSLANNAIRRPGLPAPTGIRPPYSDAALTIFTNKNNPNLRFTFHDCYPVSLGQIQLGYDESPDVIITCTASFRYSYYLFQPSA